MDPGLTRMLEAGRFAIEFRSGSYFVEQSRDSGGSRDEARTWKARAAAQRYLDDYDWIAMNGGMVVDLGGKS